MSRVIRTPAAAALAVALLGAGVMAPMGPVAGPVKATGTPAHRAGIIRVDPVTGSWFVISNAAHVPAGVTGVSCSPTTGVLTVSIVPVTSIGTFMVGMDETYDGTFTAGASAGLAAMLVQIHRPGGAPVPCDDPALRRPGSNVQVSLWGTQ